jgi:hypothetical protein
MSEFKREELTPKQLLVLSKAHIDMYEARLQVKLEKPESRMGKIVNKEETTRYLEIWKGIKEKVIGGKIDPEDFTPIEKIEINDALFDGGYDTLLKGAGPN